MERRTDSRVAEHVRRELERAGCTQDTVAELIGISQVAVSRRVRGITPWRADELATVAGHLGISVSQLFDDPDEASPPPRSRKGAA